MKGKVTALFAVLVLSLAATGIAYAAFTAQLNISGTVKTGTLDMTILSSVGAYTIESSSGFGGTVGNPGDYSTIAATIAGDTVNIVATNVYPGQLGWTVIYLKNTGSLPAQLKSITWTQGPAGVYADDISWAFDPTAWVPAGGDVFAPGDEKALNLIFTVTDEAVQSGIYTCSATFDFGVYTP